MTDDPSSSPAGPAQANQDVIAPPDVAVAVEQGGIGEDAQLKVTWGAVPAATSFEVAICWDVNTPPFSACKVVSTPASPALIPLAEIPSARFSVRVRAFAGASPGPYSSPLLRQRLYGPIPSPSPTCVIEAVDGVATMVVSLRADWVDQSEYYLARLVVDGQAGDVVRLDRYPPGPVVYDAHYEWRLAPSRVPPIVEIQALSARGPLPSRTNAIRAADEAMMASVRFALQPGAFGSAGAVRASASSNFAVESWELEARQGSSVTGSIVSVSGEMELVLADDLEPGDVMMMLWCKRPGEERSYVIWKSFPRLKPPSTLRPRYSGGVPLLEWDEPSAGADRYLARFRQGASDPGAVLEVQQSPAYFQRVMGIGGTTILLDVQAIASDGTSIPSATAGGSVAIPRAPDNLRISPTSGNVRRLMVEWDWVDGQFYVIALRGTSSFFQVVAWAATEMPVAIDLPPASESTEGEFQLVIRAEDRTTGCDSDSVFVQITRNIQQPTNLRSGYSSPEQTSVWTQWDPVPGAAHYWVGLGFPDGEIVVAVRDVTCGSTYSPNRPPRSFWVQAIGPQCSTISATARGEIAPPPAKTQSGG